MKIRAFFFILLLPWVNGFWGQETEPGDELWSLLTSVRDGLGTSAQQAEFRHEFKAPGWNQTDEETGSLTIELPFCLHLAYDEPDPKQFLLCGEDLYFWYPSDRRGQLFDVQAESDTGLDLLMLPIETLQKRYRGSVATEGTKKILSLTPLSTDSGIRAGLISLDPTSNRILSLQYTTEDEGQNTYFFTHWKNAVSTPFEPPSEITWEKQ